MLTSKLLAVFILVFVCHVTVSQDAAPAFPVLPPVSLTSKPPFSESAKVATNSNASTPKPKESSSLSNTVEPPTNDAKNKSDNSTKEDLAQNPSTVLEKLNLNTSRYVENHKNIDQSTTGVTVIDPEHGEGSDSGKQSEKDNNATVQNAGNETSKRPVSETSTEKSDQVPIKSNASNKIDTEVPDLLDIPKQVFNASNLPSAPPKLIYYADDHVDKTYKLIDDGENTEDQLRNLADDSDSHRPGVALVQGQLAAILAGVFLATSVVGYVFLLSWRRYLENRYGNREMLVNDDDFNDRDDLRHFSI